MMPTLTLSIFIIWLVESLLSYKSWIPLYLSQVLVPPGYGEDVKTWTIPPTHPPESVKESPMVLKMTKIILQQT